MSKEVLYATNNPGKIIEVSKLLDFHGIKVVSPQDLHIDLDVPETGQTLQENAILKVQAFLAVSDGRIVLSDDTGLEIDALNSEPGIHVRRWKDGKTRMGDEEIIEYCLNRMENVSLVDRGAQFKTIVALGIPNQKTQTFDGVLRGTILNKADTLRVQGFPFESLFYVTDWNLLLGHVHKLSIAEKGDKLNHREKALTKAMLRIDEILEK